MSITLFAYLDAAPSLEEMRATLTSLDLVYRHTLPADDRWDYPMHVVGRAEMRVVYHAGAAPRGEALVDCTIAQDTHQAYVAVHMLLSTLIRHYGGTICDPREVHRGAVL